MVSFEILRGSTERDMNLPGISGSFTHADLGNVI